MSRSVMKWLTWRKVYLADVTIKTTKGNVLRHLPAAELASACSAIQLASQVSEERGEDVVLVFSLPSGKMELQVPQACTGTLINVPDDQKALLMLMLDLGHVCDDVTVD